MQWSFLPACRLSWKVFDDFDAAWNEKCIHHVMSHKHLKTTLSRCLHVELIGSVGYGPLNM